MQSTLVLLLLNERERESWILNFLDASDYTSNVQLPHLKYEISASTSWTNSICCIINMGPDFLEGPQHHLPARSARSHMAAKLMVARAGHRTAALYFSKLPTFTLTMVLPKQPSHFTPIPSTATRRSTTCVDITVGQIDLLMVPRQWAHLSGVWPV